MRIYGWMAGLLAGLVLCVITQPALGDFWFTDSERSELAKLNRLSQAQRLEQRLARSIVGYLELGARSTAADAESDKMRRTLLHVTACSELRAVGIGDLANIARCYAAATPEDFMSFQPPQKQRVLELRQRQWRKFVYSGALAYPPTSSEHAQAALNIVFAAGRWVELDLATCPLRVGSDDFDEGTLRGDFSTLISLFPELHKVVLKDPAVETCWSRVPAPAGYNVEDPYVALELAEGEQFVRFAELLRQGGGLTEDEDSLNLNPSRCEWDGSLQITSRDKLSAAEFVIDNCAGAELRATTIDSGKLELPDCAVVSKKTKPSICMHWGS